MRSCKRKIFCNVEYWYGDVRWGSGPTYVNGRIDGRTATGRTGEVGGGRGRPVTSRVSVTGTVTVTVGRTETRVVADGNE